MVEYDELQGAIDLVTLPKKRRVSSADSTASVAGSVWDAEPEGCKGCCAGFAQQRSHERRCLRLSHSNNEFSKRAANCDRVLGTQLLEAVGQPKVACPNKRPVRSFPATGSSHRCLTTWQSLWRKATGARKLLSELGRLAKPA